MHKTSTPILPHRLPSFLTCVFLLFSFGSGQSGWTVIAAAEEEKPVYRFAIPMEIDISVNRTVYSIIRKATGSNTVFAVHPTGMILPMADAGECDGAIFYDGGYYLDFSDLVKIDEPIAHVELQVFTLADSPHSINGWDDLSGLSVGALIRNTEIRKKLSASGARTVLGETFSRLVHALQTGDCDAIVAIDSHGSLYLPDGVTHVHTLRSIPVSLYMNRRHTNRIPAITEAAKAASSDSSGEAGDGQRGKRILHVSSYLSDDPWEKRIELGMDYALSKRGDVDYVRVSLNTNLNASDYSTSMHVHSLVRTLYRDASPDVVLASDDAAIRFALNHYGQLFNHLPLVFCGANTTPLDKAWKTGGNVTGVHETPSLRDNIALMLQLWPDTECIMVLNDSNDTGASARRLMSEALASLAGQVKLVHNDNEPFRQTLERIASLPKRSVVWCGSYRNDSVGQYINQEELQREIRAHTEAPIFGLFYGFFGHGALGGKLCDGETQAEIGGVMALRVLDGEDIVGIEPVRDTHALNRWVFDYPALKALGIEPKQLPPNAVFHNRPLGFRESNPQAFYLAAILGILACAIIAGLSWFLVVYRRKQRELLRLQANLHTAEEMRVKERELHTSSKKLEAALQISQSGVWGIDLEREMLHYDAMTRSILRLPPGVNVTIGEFVDHLSRVDLDFKDSGFHRAFLAMNAPAMIESFEPDRRLVFPDGTRRFTRNALKLIDNNNLVGTIRDVTADITLANDLLAAKEAAETANKEKSLFLSKMSHEIRTPMNAIIGLSELLLSESMTPKQTEFVQDIRMASSSLLGIINDILDMSKLEAGKLELYPVNCNLRAMIANIDSMFTLPAKEKGIDFLVKETDRIPEVIYTDEVRLRQILINLLSNAVKFTEHGQVSLLVDLIDGKIHFVVSDTGVGIHKENLATIFQEFAQFNHNPDTLAAGTGLGMPIVKGVVDKMGGSIHIDSEPGVGTTVVVDVPCEAARDDLQNGTRILARELSCPTASVLVVDDSEVNLKVASGFLELVDIACDTATSGSEALEMVENKKYDLIFMDHMMPGMDGVETTRRILNNPLTLGSPAIVALSANAVSDARKAFSEAGMVDFLGKPIRRGELLDILEKWLPPEKVEVKTTADDDKRQADPFLDALAVAVPEINVTVGLSGVGGRTETYRQTLRLLERTLEPTCARLEQGLEAPDTQDIEMAAHALKSALATIGAEDLAKEAATAEDAAKQGNLNLCRARIPPFTRALKELQRRLADFFASQEDESPRPPGDPEALAKELDAVKGLLAAFEADPALNLLVEQSGLSFTPEIDRLLDEARREVEDFDYDRAVAVIEAIQVLLSQKKESPA